MASEIPGFLITFREALEAALIVAILLAYLKKIGKVALARYVWFGTGLAVLVSLMVGGVVLLVYGGLSGVASELFEGVASLTATGILTYMIFWMARNSKKIKGELERKVDLSLTKGQLLGIAALAFVAVMREGIETVLFLTALFVLDVRGTVIGVVTGGGAVIVLAALMLRGSVKLPIRSFFKYTSVLLVVFSAGLFGTGVHELIEAAEGSGFGLGFLGQAAFNINPVDLSNPIHENGVVGSILKALLGYDGNPEWVRVVAYVSYWMLIGAYVVKTYAPSFTLGIYRVLFGPKTFPNGGQRSTEE